VTWRGRWLANRKPSVRVYLDATGLSMAMFTVPRRSRIRARVQSAGIGRLSQVGIANESDQVT